MIGDFSMTVRAITSNDKEEFLKQVESFYGCHATLRDYDEELTLKTFNYLMSKPQNSWGYFIMNEIGIVGYALVTSYWCNEEGGCVLILDELFIDSEYRHHGYGKEFLLWLEKEFKNKAVGIDLEVLSTNTEAKKLYASDGLFQDGFVTLSKRLNN